MKCMKCMLWRESVDMNELKGINWNEWIETNELKRMNWHEWFVDLIFKKVEKNLRNFDVYVKSSSRYSPRAPFVDLIFKSGKKKTVFGDFYWSTTWWRCGRQMQWRSRYSRARTLSTSWSTSIFKKCSEPVSFLRFLCEIELSLHFVDLIFKKCKKGCQYLTISMWDRALATVLCTFCRPLSGSRPSSGDHRQPLHPKKHKVLRPRVLFQPWIHAFPIAHTSQLLDDNAIDMMTGWWFGTFVFPI